MPGTDLAYGGTPMSGTDLVACSAICLRSGYAMPVTDLAYAATRCGTPPLEPEHGLKLERVQSVDEERRRERERERARREQCAREGRERREGGVRERREPRERGSEEKAADHIQVSPYAAPTQCP
eukprot:2255486-Rhodomonas_salina.1